jgi:hypothetical protein
MANTLNQQNDFSYGAISPRFLGRVNLPFYQSAAREIENMVVLKEGGLTRRPGWQLASAAKASQTKIAIYSFESLDEVWIDLEIGNGYTRCYSNGHILKDSSGAIEITTPWDADEAFEVHVQPIYVAQELHDGTGYETYEHSLIITHKNHVPWVAKVSQEALDVTGIEMSELYYIGWDKLEGSAVTYLNGAGPYTMGVTITSAGEDPVEEAADVGRYMTIHVDVGAQIETWVFEIEAIDAVNHRWTCTEATNPSAKIQVIGEDPASTAFQHNLPVMGIGFTDFDPRTYYPISAMMFENRLVFVGTTLAPTSVRGSQALRPFDFRGGTTDERAYRFVLNDSQGAYYKWAVAGNASILLGSNKGVFALFNDGVLTPTAVPYAVRQSSNAVEDADPVFMEDLIVFIQKGGLNVRAFRYDEAVQKYVSPELSKYAEHLMRPGVKKIVYQSTPIPILWALRTDGIVLSMTYSPDNGIMAWTSHSVDDDVTVLDISVSTLYSGRQVLVGVLLHDDTPIVCNLYDFDDNFSVIENTQYLDLSDIHNCGASEYGSVKRLHSNVNNPIVVSSGTHPKDFINARIVLDNDAGSAISGTYLNNLTDEYFHICKVYWGLPTGVQSAVIEAVKCTEAMPAGAYIPETTLVQVDPLPPNFPGSATYGSITFFSGEVRPEENFVTVVECNLPSHSGRFAGMIWGTDEDWAINLKLYIDSNQRTGATYFHILGGINSGPGWCLYFNRSTNHLTLQAKDTTLAVTTTISFAIAPDTWYNVLIVNAAATGGATHQMFLQANQYYTKTTSAASSIGTSAACFLGYAGDWQAPKMKLTWLRARKWDNAGSIDDGTADWWMFLKIQNSPYFMAGFGDPHDFKRKVTDTQTYSIDWGAAQYRPSRPHDTVMLFDFYDDASYSGEVVDKIKYNSQSGDHAQNNMTISNGTWSSAECPVPANTLADCLKLNATTSYMLMDMSRFESSDRMDDPQEASIMFWFKYKTSEITVDTNYMIFGGNMTSANTTTAGCPCMIFRLDSVNGVTITFVAGFNSGVSQHFVSQSVDSLTSDIPNDTWVIFTIRMDAVREAFWIRLDTQDQVIPTLNISKKEIMHASGSAVGDSVMFEYDANGFRWGSLPSAPAGYQTGIIGYFFDTFWYDTQWPYIESIRENSEGWATTYDWFDSPWTLLESPTNDPVGIQFQPANVWSYHFWPHADDTLLFTIDGAAAVSVAVQADGAVYPNTPDNTPFNTVVGGYAYDSYVRLLRHPRLAGLQRRVAALDLIVSDSATGSIGDSLTNLSPLSYDDNLAYNAANEAFTGVLHKSFPGGHDRDGDVYIVANTGLPFNLMQVVQYLMTED